MSQINPLSPPLSPRVAELVVQSRLFATALVAACEYHKDQTRKYSGDPYIVHPIEVAETLLSSLPDLTPTVRVDMACAALLHDVVEDCGATFNEIESVFGVEVRNLVYWLTDITPKSVGNRRVRKELEAERVANAPIRAQLIKLCDFISNTSSIVENDPGFARVYLSEKERCLSRMRSVWVSRYDKEGFMSEHHKALFDRAQKQIGA